MISLTFSDNGIWFNFLVHEVLLFSVGHVLVLDKVEVIASEEIKLVFHLPDF